MKIKPIGCICKEITKENKCPICIRLEDPRYSLVKVNLAPSRIVPGEKHLAPILLPMPREVPLEVREFLKNKRRGTSNLPSNLPTGTKSPFTCAYGGKDTSNRVVCPSCGGTKVQLKVFECLLPEVGSCTVDKKVDGIQCCKDCNKFQPK